MLSHHPSIAPARQFSISDGDYQDFVKWMKDKPYVYKSALETQWAELLAESKRERSYNDLKPQLDQIASRLDELRKNDLIVFRDQIRQQLEKEIASRYYLEPGMVEAGFKNDADVKEAQELFEIPRVIRRS